MCNIKSSLQSPPAVVIIKSSMGQTECKSYISRHSTQNLCQCVSIYVHKNVNTLLAPRSKDVTHVQHHDIRFCKLQHQTTNMETTQKLIYAPKYGFHCADFHETHNHSVSIRVVIFCTEFYLQSKKNAQNVGKVSSTTLHKLDIMWQSSASSVTKSINQYGKYKFDLHPHASMTETGLPFEELIMAVPFCEDLLHCIS